MSLAVAQAILGAGNYALEMKRLGRLYPNAGYGSSFGRWMSDTLACTARGIAGAFYKEIPILIQEETKIRLPHHLRQILENFINRYSCLRLSGGC